MISEHSHEHSFDDEFEEKIEEENYLDKKDRVTYFGMTDFRGVNEKFGVKADDRTRHMYVIGKTGMGKSTLLENMAIQDIQNGEGLCFIDPHGTTAEKLLKYVPEHRLADVVYFAPFDTKYPVALNILEHVDEDYRHLVASGLMDAFKKVFGEDVFSGRMVYLLNNAVLSLLENEGESLLGINRIFSDKDYRKKIIANVKDSALLSFWRDEFAKYEDRYVKEATAAIQNKIGQFIMTPLIRNIIGQKHTSFDIRKIMDERKILICNFSIGQTGSENVNLIGSLLITKIYLAAMSRANLSEDELKKSAPFYFYVDEFQNFVNDSFAQILSQARKYNLGLVIAHQYIDQLTDNVKAAVFGNIGSMLTFRVGATDAEILEKEFAPQFTADDIVNLGARQIYLRLSIDGVGSKPFSARTMPPIDKPDVNYVPAIIAHSRVLYGKDKILAEEEIQDWYKPVIDPAIIQEKNREEARIRIEKRNSEFKNSNTVSYPKTSPQNLPKNLILAKDLVDKTENLEIKKDNFTKINSTSNNLDNNSKNNNIKNTFQKKYSESKEIIKKVDNNLGLENKNNNDGREENTELKYSQNKDYKNNRKDDRKIENKNLKIDNLEKQNKVEQKSNNALRDALSVAMSFDIKEDKGHHENKYVDQKKLNELLDLEE